MKRVTFVATALISASLLVAGTASAGGIIERLHSRPAASQGTSQTMWTQQSPTPPNPTVRTPVAGYSPNFAAPQPATMEILTRDANRLIRWQGWLDIDAFSVSVLNQMQRQLQSGAIQAGSYTLADEPALAQAVFRAAKRNPTFEKCGILKSGEAINFEGTPTLYVWTYRHNFADRGLYQLYISAKGKMFIGWEIRERCITDPPEPHKDIQSLYYEFGNFRDAGSRTELERVPVYADVEIWRGVVILVDHAGRLVVAGTQNCPDNPSLNMPLVSMPWTPVQEVPGGLLPLPQHQPVNAAPMSHWERAPSLICNPNYNPRSATGPRFVEPLERAITIRENAVQREAGDVQSRVRVFSPWRFR